MRIRWTEPAVSDLEQICGYLEQHAGPRVAERIGRSIFDGIGTLARFPELGRTGCRAETRELVFTHLPYIAIYRIIENASKFFAFCTVHSDGLSANLIPMLFLHRNYAPMRHFAHRVLELNSGVINAEVAVQTLFHVPQNAFAG